MEFKNSAAKELRKLAADVRRVIGRKIDALAIDPRPHGYLKLVDADDLYRIRAGDYRIIYRIEDAVLIVEVVKVADRKDVYGP